MNMLAIVAHPDDEILGAGGTLAREAAEGNDVHVLVMAQGATSRGPGQEGYQSQLYKQAKKVQKLLGFQSYSFANFPDQQMDSKNMLTLVKSVESHVQRLQPRIVYTHWHGDLNLDHRLTAEAVLTACRPQPGHPVKEIYAMEVPSATGWSHQHFQPNVYVDINTPYWELKHNALAMYLGEMRPSPHARSDTGVYALAQHRGHTVGLEMAEAFELVRMVIP